VAVAAALHVTPRRVKAANAAVDAPLSAECGGRSGVHMVGGAPAAAAAAAAAAGGAVAGARFAALTTTAMVRPLLIADGVSTPVPGFPHHQHYWS